MVSVLNVKQLMDSLLMKTKYAKIVTGVAKLVMDMGMINVLNAKQIISLMTLIDVVYVMLNKDSLSMD